jgi:omega-6 fatty acid desaturase (delta-12 desaturase)
VMKKLPELQRPKRTSLNPRDIARCLSLKVWDVGSQRMTGIKLAAQEA